MLLCRGPAVPGSSYAPAGRSLIWQDARDSQLTVCVFAVNGQGARQPGRSIHFMSPLTPIVAYTSLQGCRGKGAMQSSSRTMEDCRQGPPWRLAADSATRLTFGPPQGRRIG